MWEIGFLHVGIAFTTRCTFISFKASLVPPCFKKKLISGKNAYLAHHLVQCNIFTFNGLSAFCLTSWDIFCKNHDARAKERNVLWAIRFYVFSFKSFRHIIFFSYLCTDQVVLYRLTGQHLNGILWLSTPFVRTAKGKRRLWTLSFCGLKLRNFETSHRGNATERLRG